MAWSRHLSNSSPFAPRLVNGILPNVLVPTLKPGRRIEGISAVLLPFGSDDRPDWPSYRQLLDRTWAAGLMPAVNMDTGYINLLDETTRARVLDEAQALAAGRGFVAGAFIEGEDGDPTSLYRRRATEIRAHGGLPILFPCSALGRADESEILRAYRDIGHDEEPILAFELGQMFVPFGRIFTTDFLARLMEIPAFVGVKHSSLDRCLELDRLALRDRCRPAFKIYTGNDLAIDMVFYGSDYLLGLSAFHPEAFAVRDRLWAEGDARSLELNDLLQYLGQLAFRHPVPAYKHSAAQFLHLRHRITTARAHPLSPTRPESDVPLLADIRDRLEAALEAVA